MSRGVRKPVSGMQRQRRLVRLAPLAFVLGSGACASVLGIEDIHEGPRLGAGGAATAGGSNPTGGANAVGGKSGNGGSNLQTDGGAGNGSSDLGGSGNVDGGTGGAPFSDPTVRGRVIDFWGFELGGVAVQIGDALVSTNAKGEFTVENVANEYDVSMKVDIDEGRREIYGWVYQGLTRRDPTLQVTRGTQDRSGTVTFLPSNVTIGANQTLGVALGGPGVSYSREVGQGGVTVFPDWSGPPNAQAMAHGLLWQHNAGTGLPSSYLAYDSTVAALVDGASSTITLDMSADTIAKGTLEGTITPGTGSDRENNVYVRFGSGASIQLLNDVSANVDTFSYEVPMVANASLSFSATEGDSYGPYGLVHRDGLTAGGAAIMGAIPRPPILVKPVGGATGVNDATEFAFQGSPDSPGAYVVKIISNSTYDGLYIVTEKTKFTLPKVVGGGYTLPAGKVHTWHVATHGKLATVDAMTGPTGFMDAYSGPGYAPAGLRQGDGQYTLSTPSGFTIAP